MLGADDDVVGARPKLDVGALVVADDQVAQAVDSGLSRKDGGRKGLLP